MTTITLPRAVAEQALEALEKGATVSAAIILRAALAEPPTSKPWVGLTKDERTDICDDYGANIHWRAFRAIEAKLQEKNT